MEEGNEGKPITRKLPEWKERWIETIEFWSVWYGFLFTIARSMCDRRNVWRSVPDYRRTTNLAWGGTFFSTTPYSSNPLTNFFTRNNFGYLEAIQMAPPWGFLSYHFYPLQMIIFCRPLNHPRGPKNRIIGGVKSGNSKIATVAPFVLPQGIQNSSKWKNWLMGLSCRGWC